MTRLTARVALASARAAAQTQSRAISLNVTETLAVVALLGCFPFVNISNIQWLKQTLFRLTLSGSRVRAVVALVAWVGGLAVVLR
jgi:hypothetical protein